MLNVSSREPLFWRDQEGALVSKFYGRSMWQTAILSPYMVFCFIRNLLPLKNIFTADRNERTKERVPLEKGKENTCSAKEVENSKDPSTKQKRRHSGDVTDGQKKKKRHRSKQRVIKRKRKRLKKEKRKERRRMKRKRGRN